MIYQWPGKATGETKKEKKTKQNLPKPRKPKAEPGHYIDKCIEFLAIFTR